jgi:hypothetical protein
MMAFKLLMLAKERWRRHASATCGGVPFVDGVQIERREDEENRKEAA